MKKTVLSIAIVCALNSTSVNAQSMLDTDKDGIPDTTEISNGLNPNDPSDALKDADKDGLTNFKELSKSNLLFNYLPIRDGNVSTINDWTILNVDGQESTLTLDNDAIRLYDNSRTNPQIKNNTIDLAKLAKELYEDGGKYEYEMKPIGNGAFFALQIPSSSNPLNKRLLLGNFFSRSGESDLKLSMRDASTYIIPNAYDGELHKFTFEFNADDSPPYN